METPIEQLLEFLSLATTFFTTLRWPETLTAIFTALTAYIAWKVMKGQHHAALPSAFLGLDKYQNGLTLRVTIRNRHSHPIRVTNIEVSKPRSIKLAPVRGSSSGHIGSGVNTQPVHSVSYGDAEPKASWPLDITLGSQGRGSDNAYRDFVIFTTSKKLKKITVTVKIDPSDGTNKIWKLSRSITVNSQESALITVTPYGV